MDPSVRNFKQVILNLLLKAGSFIQRVDGDEVASRREFIEKKKNAENTLKIRLLNKKGF